MHIGKWQKEVLKKIKPVTWNNYIRHLSALYNFLIKREIITYNPFKHFSIREDNVPHKIFSEKMLTQIENVLARKEHTLPTALQPIWFINSLVNLFKYTAIRRGQLLKLTISDIDLEQKLITIPSHINKNHTFHQIPIPQKIYIQVEKLVIEMKRNGQNSKSQLFNINVLSKTTTRKNKNMNDNQLSYIFAIISQLVNFKVSPHRFRHTLATKLMKDPQNVYVTKQLLGHKSLKTTLSYICYDPESLRNILDTLK